MKTLFVNINNSPISPSDELVTMDYDLISDFFFYLGERIGKGCKIQNENALITDFNTPENKQDYDLILSQWNEVKRLLFGEEVIGSFNFELPSGYLHWLRYNDNEDYNHVYEANFANGGSRSVTIDLEELYEDSVEALQRKIIRKLNRDDLYLEIDEIVFNVEDISRKSKIVCTIKEKYESIGFKAYKKWMQEHDCRCANCESTTNEPNDCEKIDKLFPLHNVILHKTSSKSKSIKKKYLEQEDGFIYYRPTKGITFIQEPTFAFFSIVCIENGHDFPKYWENILGLKWGTTFNECSSALKKNNNKILWEKENDHTAGAWTHTIVFISADNNHVFDLGFMHGHLDHIRVFLYQCPFCHSNHIEISNRYSGIVITCEDCGRRSGDTPSCPSCFSEDVYDDGSDYLQYTCNDCGHNWGHDDTIECPECGSNDIENDGTDNLQYECNACGHIWGEDEEADDEDGFEDEEDEIDFDHPLSLNDFFPVCGITLNKSTVKDAERQSHRYAEIEYDNSGLVIAWTKNGNYKGSQIRKEKNSNLFTTIYTSNSDKMFPEWSKLGFDWNLSYNEWISLFKRMGFTIIQTQEPRVSSWEHGPDYFDAELVTISKDNSLKFKLNFMLGRFGSTHNSCSTLATISVYSKDYCFDCGGSIKETFNNIEDFGRKEPKKYL